MNTETREQEPDQEVIIFDKNKITQFDPFRAQLELLKKENAAMVFNFEDPQQNKAGRSHIHKLRQTKAAIDKARKAAKKEAKEYGEAVDEKGNALIGDVQEMIDNHVDQLEAFEEKEQQRIEKHQNGILIFSQYRQAFALGEVSCEEINKLISIIEKVDVNESWEEYEDDAIKAKADALADLQVKLAHQQQIEDDRAELQKLQREKAEREQREADEEEQRRLDAEAEQQEKERIEAIQEKVERFRSLMKLSYDQYTVDQLRDLQNGLTVITEDVFQEFTAEAIDARDDASQFLLARINEKIEEERTDELKSSIQYFIHFGDLNIAIHSIDDLQKMQSDFLEHEILQAKYGDLYEEALDAWQTGASNIEARINEKKQAMDDEAELSRRREEEQQQEQQQREQQQREQDEAHKAQVHEDAATSLAAHATISKQDALKVVEVISENFIQEMQMIY